jgi:hypothetical protein
MCLTTRCRDSETLMLLLEFTKEMGTSSWMPGRTQASVHHDREEENRTLLSLSVVC